MLNVILLDQWSRKEGYFMKCKKKRVYTHILHSILYAYSILYTDRMSTDGGCEAALIARTTFGWVYIRNGISYCIE